MISFAKKFLSLALAAVLLLGVLPMAASADTYTVHFHVDGVTYDVTTAADGTIGKKNADYKSANAAANALANKGSNGKFEGWKFQKGGGDFDRNTFVATGNNTNLVPKYAAPYVCPHDKTHEVVVTKATCDAAGMKRVVCDKCGETVTDNISIPALGHNWGKWTVTKAPTAVSEGIEERSCNRCGQSEVRSIAKSEDPIHVWKLTFDENKPAEFNNSALTTYEIKDGQRIGALFAKGLPIPACNLHVFRGWYLVDADGDMTNVRVTSETIYDYGRNVTLKAKWAREARVNLMIYRNGNTQVPYDVVPLYGYAVGDVIYTKDLNIKSYYNNGGKPFDFAGWYDRGGWTLFKAQDNPKPASAIETVDLNGDTTLFCMITDHNAPSSNKNPDRTNPKTGDESMIIASTAVMLVSAGALAVFFMDRKRRNG